MEKSIEAVPVEKHHFLEEEDFKNLIELRKIAPEDFHILEELIRYDKNFSIGMLHNFFSFSRENSHKDIGVDIKNLETELKRADDAESKILLEKEISFLKLFLEFTQKYDYMAADHLNRVLERRKIKPASPIRWYEFKEQK